MKRHSRLMEFFGTFAAWKVGFRGRKRPSRLHVPATCERRSTLEGLRPATPGLADTASLEHDVLEIAACKLSTHRQAGLAGADNHDVHRLLHRITRS
jgi:hypothetical protein